MVKFVRRLISLLLPLVVVVSAACANQTANVPSGAKTLIVGSNLRHTTHWILRGERSLCRSL